MTAHSSPEPAAFVDAGWDDIAPFYEELATRPLDAAGAEGWLRDWSALDEAVGEAAARASVAYTTDTTDPAKGAAHLRFSSEIGPRLLEQRVRLARRLLDLGYGRPDLATTLRRFRNARDLFRAENVPLAAELATLSPGYQRLVGGLTATWDSQEIPLPRLRPHRLDPDRAVRERAFRLGTRPYIAHRDEFADLFDRQRALRRQVARNAGFASYRDYAHREADRLDYTPDDCARLGEAVEATVVPAIARRAARRRRQMGLAALRPWDTGLDPDYPAPDPLGRPPLRPFAATEGLVAPARRIFARVDPELGAHFRALADEELLDLESRRGKAPGAYCASFPRSARPFIFMNATGVARDVRTLLHESGPAFPEFATFRLPLVFQRFPGAEMAEVAAIAMELLAAPYLGRAEGGYYEEADARRHRVEQLEGFLTSLAHIAAIDAFQGWVYADAGGADRDARDAAWLRIRSRFQRGVDWSGLEAERIARWYEQRHIFLYPFYYIEYGIALLGALQIWRNARRDQAAAVAAYKRALALGATATLPELFAAAGARLAFDAGMLGELVALIEEELAALEG